MQAKNKPSAKTLITRLKRRGMSKWAMAKHLGVSWNTLHAWERGYPKPNEQNMAALIELASGKVVGKAP